MRNTYTHGRICCPVALPDGNGGWTPCPELLTEEDAIRYLRLDIDSSSDNAQTLRYYREKGILIAIRVGRANRYRRIDLDAFLEKKSRLKNNMLKK